MPWTVGDAKDHIKGLTAHQATVWAAVANSGLKSCLADGGSQGTCEGRAIRQANAMAQRAPATAPKKTDSTGLSHLGAALELKAVDISQRIISGYAAVSGNLDRVGDIIDAAAFTKTLAEKPPGDVAVFIGHQTHTLPVGIPLTLQADAKGLFSETLIKPGPVGDDLLETAAFLQRHGRSLGLSIGYRTRDSKMERVNGKMVRRLLDVDVMEYSFAASQSIANPQALVIGVKAQAGATYTVEHDGAAWRVLDTADGDVVGTYDDQATADAVAAALNTEMVEEMDDALPGTGKTLGGPLMTNDLPNSAFLWVEDGDDDEHGRRVPRTKRHFPCRDAEGKLDPAALAQTLAAIPTTAGLDVVTQQQLAGRVQRMLVDAQAGQAKTVAEEAEWQAGAVPLVAYVGYTLLAAVDQIAEGQKAMALLGEDTKTGQRMQGPMRAQLRAAMATLKNVLDWADMADAGTEQAAKLAGYDRDLELLELAVAS